MTKHLREVSCRRKARIKGKRQDREIISARAVLGVTSASMALTEAWDERLELQEWMNKGLNEKSKLLNGKTRGSENGAS